MKNVLCVDLEDWYNANLANGIDKACAENRVVENTNILLSIFREAQIHCTFFVLGCIAEKYPELILRIKQDGHEIASHGYAHQLIYDQTKEEFRQDIRKAKQILESIIHIPVESYRAPSWSIREETFWALEILQEEGFKNDSSIFPFRNFLYGVSGAPRFIYSTQIYSQKSFMKEFPPSTVRICGINIPFSGGFYFRFLPFWFVSGCIRALNRKGHACIMYIHPWEIDMDTPRISLPFRDRFIQYWGIRRCRSKLVKLVTSFAFVPMNEME